MRTLQTAISAFVLFLLSTLFLGTTAYAEEPAPTYTDEVTGMQFVYIPGGTFTMGDPSGKDPSATPALEATVDPFYLGKFEVTFSEYDQFAKETKRELPNDERWGRGIRPVINVNWDDAVAFTKWLSKKTGKKFRLPSEAEWEFAARGGTTTSYYWGEAFSRSAANCNSCGNPWDGKQTAAIGSFTPNPYGLHDMAGNVYEWCLDIRNETYKGHPTDGSPRKWGGLKDPRGREFRANRGGSWFQSPIELTVFRRCWDAAEEKRDELGFRVLMEP